MKFLSAKLMKLIGWLAGIGLIIIALSFLVAMIFYSFEYIRRIIVWQESDVNDYLYNFPQHSFTPAPTPFFPLGPDKRLLPIHYARHQLQLHHIYSLPAPILRRPKIPIPKPTPKQFASICIAAAFFRCIQ